MKKIDNKWLIGGGIVTALLLILIFTPILGDTFGWDSTGEGCITSYDRAVELATETEENTAQTCTITRIHMIKGYPYCMDANLWGFDAEHYLVYCAQSFEAYSGSDVDDNKCSVDTDCDKMENKAVEYWKFQVAQNVIFSDLTCVEGRCKQFLEPDVTPVDEPDDDDGSIINIIIDEDDDDTIIGIDDDIDDKDDLDDVIDDITDEDDDDDSDAPPEENTETEEINDVTIPVILFVLVMIGIVIFIVQQNKKK